MTQRPSTKQAWWLAIRPRTLTISVVPVVVGSALAFAAGTFHLLGGLAALVGALAIQAGTNLFNDYADHKKGADTSERLGPPRVCASGWLPPQAVLRATVVAYVLAMSAGIVLVWLAGWPIVVIGLVALACGLAYTGGPIPLAYLGIADLFVFVFFGPVAVGGTYYVHTGTLDVAPVLAGAALGAMATAILVVNNLRDRHGDRQAEKRTLAVRFGEAFARKFYTGLMLLPFLLTGFWAVATGHWTLLFSWLMLVPVWHLIREVRVVDGRALNPILGRTAQVQMKFGLLLVLGVLI